MNTADDDRVSRLEERLKALDRLVAEQFKARDEALKKVSEETERVRNQQNEWRGTVNDLAQLKVDVTVFDQFRANVEEKIGFLSTAVAQSQGYGAGAWALIGLFLGVGGLIIAIAVAVLTNI